MDTFFYLHVHSSGEIDSKTKIINKSIHPVEIDNIGLELSDWPADDLFQSWPAFLSTNRLAAKIIHRKFTGIDFQEVNRVVADYNFKAFYPGFHPGNYYWLKIYGEIGKDDFALFNRIYLVVSERTLQFLRDNHVTYAESDAISVPFSEYFDSDRKNFWIELERKRLAEKGLIKTNVERV